MPTRSDRLRSSQNLGSPKLVGVHELARAVHKHPDTIRNWGRTAGMPYHQPAGAYSRWVIDMDEFDKWFRSRCSSPQDRRR